MEILPNVGSPAIFDFGAQGPTFGVDGLRIPLETHREMARRTPGRRCYDLVWKLEEMHKSAWSHYASTTSDGINVFAKGEKNETELELVALVSPSMERDGLYVS